MGGAHVCLMFMNHLEHHKRLVEFIRTDMNKFPRTWNLNQPPDWTQAIDNICLSLGSDLETTNDEASKVRKLVGFVDKKKVHNS